MGRIGTVLATLVVFILLLILVGMVYVYSGAYNVAATKEHTGVVRWVLEATTERSIATRSAEVDLPSDSTTLRRGFGSYEEMCVQCHGAPGVDRGWIGAGLEPTPPRLHDAASEMSAGEIYWVIRHGMKFTGMPALEPTHTDEQIKEVAAFVIYLGQTDSSTYADWRRQATMVRSAQPDSAAAAGGHMHEDGHAHTH